MANNKKYKFSYKYGVVTDISRDGIEITETKMKKNFEPKKTKWWVDWPQPAKTMPLGTKVSYVEVTPKNKYPDFIRSIEKVNY
ncbi:MAG: hypothetical protein HUJ25_10880 [Crocinitomicaceae bacterium]|nr:hypothetical protein [Crocinitomicaceae bacterium]